MAGTLQTIDRRERDDYQVPKGQSNGAKKGDIVEAEETSGGKGSKKATVRKILGHREDTDAISLIAIHEFGVPMDFSEDALDQARSAQAPELEDFRTDLRHIPFVTIDGADARDFDDAVYARHDDHPTNPDGYYVIVAIADVAKYVRPDSPLDQDAFERGNSVYFPDRVVPMLPEELSNGLCSLRPDEDRAALAMHMRISKDGELRDFKCQRAMIRSVARLTYTQVHHARQGNPDDQTGPIYDTLIAPLYDVFETLKAARIDRGALEIDRPERKIHIDDTGNLERVSVRERFDSHRVIEELMIQANVAAGRLLEGSETPGLYRVHDKPDLEKITAVRPLLHDLGYPLTTGEDIHPRDLNAVLMQAKQKDEQPLISELVLRCQSNATYSPNNIGHFGLGLDTYAHFTSPIRRYADLVVHRALIEAMGLGTGGQIRDDLVEVGEHISDTERRATLAERNTVDRFTARYLTDHIGEEYKGRITGVTSFGLFVLLEEVGADGILPMRNMKGDYFVHEEDKHALVGKRTGAVFRLAAPVRVVVVEADGITGSLVLKMAKGIKDADFKAMAAAS
jgi:ribonuclease R